MPAPRNRTIRLTKTDQSRFRARLAKLKAPAVVADVENKTIHQDLFSALPFLPSAFADMIFVDPPYNLDKAFGPSTFKARTLDAYAEWLGSWLPALLRTAKPEATVYLCGDWRSSPALHQVAAKYLTIRNRITWEREKGRGAAHNWKNSSEDIIFCTCSKQYTFSVDAVKLRRQVRAPYRDRNGLPKDWQATEKGNYRDTYPSNLWTDVTVPFWSMAENTEHPAQKPEKLLAKLILASTREGDLILDPFLGSGTTSVVAKKLRRRWIGIEQNRDYCMLTEKRLEMADLDPSVQGYDDGVFWERNSS